MSWAGALRGFVRHDRRTLLSAAAAAGAAAAAMASGAWTMTSRAEGNPASASSAADSGAAPATAPASASTDAPRLPTHKLACRAGVPPPRTPLVLVACGSFNPPTVMHLRCAELAADELRRRGYDVWGAYLSPVADAYGKNGLVPAADRVAMCRLAAGETPELPPSTTGSGSKSGSRTGVSVIPGCSASRSDPEPDLVMVYDWEARQSGYTRTLAVLRRVEGELREWLDGAGAAVAPAPPAPAETGKHATPPQAPGMHAAGAAPAPAPSAAAAAAAEPQPVRAMLLCGADVLASMAVPGVWRDPDVILREHGVVCVDREGTDLQRLLDTPGTVLYDHRDRVVLVYDRVGNTTSSSAVRAELAAGRPVRHLVPPGVLSYIYEKGLYGAQARVVGGGEDA